MVMIADVDTHTALWNQVKAELNSGEEILWVGKPIPLRVVLVDGGLLMGALNAIMVVAVLVFFTSSATPFMQSIPSFNLFLLFFVGIGLYSVSRPIYAFIMARRMVYGLTNRRAIIIKPALNGKKVESYTDSDTIERHDLPNGKGDLIFKHERGFYRQSGRTRTRIHRIGFFGIDDAQKVEALMLKTFDGEKPKNDSLWWSPEE